MAVIWSPIVSNTLLKKYNSKNAMAIGMAALGLIIALFGLLDGVITSNTLVFVYCTILRILQGIAASTMQTTCYAVGTWEHPDKTNLLLGGIEVMTGLGIILGPLMGTPIYSYLGFMMCFGVIGFSMVVLAVVFYFMCPDFKPFEHKEEHETKKIGSGSSEITEKDIGIITLFKNPRFTMASIAATLAYF
jgi:MFS family permease